MGWQVTHGPHTLVPGAYRKAASHQLYVRQDKSGKGWLVYLNGELVGSAADQDRARKMAEAHAGLMDGTHTPRIAALAKR